MGYYLNAGLPRLGKATSLKSDFDAQEISVKDIPSWQSLPKNKILIFVVSNGLFEAALVCVDQSEHNMIIEEIAGENRPFTLLLMDRKAAYDNCGYEAKSSPHPKP
jgi:hypothetical protein